MSGRAIELVVAGAMVGTMMAGTLVAQTHKELRFNVGSRANLSVNNPYGSISVKPSPGNTVVVNAILSSDKVEVDSGQTGNRVDIQSHLLPGATVESGHVDYEIFVPTDTSVSLRSTTGPMHAEGLHGDMTLEGAAAIVEVATDGDDSLDPCRPRPFQHADPVFIILAVVNVGVRIHHGEEGHSSAT